MKKLTILLLLAGAAIAQVTNPTGSVTISGTATVAGNKTNNAAAPGATNVGTLPAVATAAAPSYTEGRQVSLSTDLSGLLRVNVTSATVSGPAASGAAKSGNPVQIGAVFNTTQPTVTNGQIVEAQASARGSLLVTPGVEGFPVTLTANQSVNVTQLNGTTTDTNSGVKSAGTLRVVIATDQPQLTNKLLVTPDANSAVNVAQYGGTNVVNGGVAGTVGIGGQSASGASKAGNPVQISHVFNTTQPTVTTGQTVEAQASARGSLLVTPGVEGFAVTMAANSSVNVAQINGVTPLMGNGATGTGSLRVTVASDNTAFSVNSTLSAETTKVIGTVRVLGNTGATVDSAPAAIAPTNTVQVGGTFTTTPTTLTTGQAGSLQLTAAQNLKHDLTTVAGTVTDVNAGNASAGSQRIVLATDQAPVQVRGPAATGAAVSGNPVYIGGIDTAGNVRPPVLTTNGIIVLGNRGTAGDTLAANVAGLTVCVDGVTCYQPVFQYVYNNTTWDRQRGDTNGTWVEGPAASGATKAGNPLQIGGVFNTTQPTVTNGQAVEGQFSARGSLLVTAGVEGLTVLPGNTANTTPWLHAPATEATTANSALTSYLTSAASTNSTSVKGSAGNVYAISIVNTTATLYYLRMYNSSSAPTCSSATGFVETIPIPASTTGAGIVRTNAVPQGYTTGIGYCITGGGGSTDNTNAATGVYLTILYK